MRTVGQAGPRPRDPGLRRGCGLPNLGAPPDTSHQPLPSSSHPCCPTSKRSSGFQGRFLPKIALTPFPRGPSLQLRPPHLPDVVTVHVLLRAPVDNPIGQLVPTAAAQHHAWRGGNAGLQSPPHASTPNFTHASPWKPPPTPFSHLGVERVARLPAGLNPAPQASPISTPPGPSPVRCPLTCAVETTAKEESTELRSLPHQGLVVGREGF